MQVFFNYVCSTPIVLNNFKWWSFFIGINFQFLCQFFSSISNVYAILVQSIEFSVNFFSHLRFHTFFLLVFKILLCLLRIFKPIFSAILFLISNLLIHFKFLVKFNLYAHFFQYFRGRRGRGQKRRARGQRGERGGGRERHTRRDRDKDRNSEQR